MSKPTPPDGYIIERLDTTVHEREGFACGRIDLDMFLKTQANQQQNRLVGGTHVLLEAKVPAEGKRQVVGFLTLVTTAIPLVSCPTRFKKFITQDALTVMLLARMAVHLDHSGKGLGTFLVQYAFASAVTQAEISGCPAIVVDPKEDVLNFYPKYGFIPLLDNPKRMIIATATAKAMLPD